MTDTDDLLDEATRLTKAHRAAKPYSHAEFIAKACDLVEALAERVRELWEANEVNSGEAAIFLVERDEARGKLDAVHRKAELEVIRTRPLGSDERRHWVDVLAILDGKAPTRPQDATNG